MFGLIQDQPMRLFSMMQNNFLCWRASIVSAMGVLMKSCILKDRISIAAGFILLYLKVVAPTAGRLTTLC